MTAGWSRTPPTEARPAHLAARFVALLASVSFLRRQPSGRHCDCRRGDDGALVAQAFAAANASVVVLERTLVVSGSTVANSAPAGAGCGTD